MNPNNKQAKTGQEEAFSCVSCGAAFSTIEELEQHELNCGEQQGAEEDEQDQELEEGS